MEISYDSAIRDSVFRFLVGKHRQPMTIHTAFVAEQSSALRALVTGSMEEAKTGTAIWEDVEEETFARFAQFVYTGDYPPPSCSMVKVSSDDSPIEEPVETRYEEPIKEHMAARYEEPKEDSNLGGFFGSTIATSKKERKKRQQVVDHVGFHNLTYPVPSLSKFTEKCMIRSNKSSTEDYTPVFLGHARLYILAEKWDIEPLKALVLYKLYTTLSKYTPYEARYGDIVELIRYIYENTPCRKRIDGLRDLVTQYVAYETPQIAKSEPCLSLVEDIGPFARDLLSTVLE